MQPLPILKDNLFTPQNHHLPQEQSSYIHHNFYNNEEIETKYFIILFTYFGNVNTLLTQCKQRVLLLFIELRGTIQVRIIYSEIKILCYFMLPHQNKPNVSVAMWATEIATLRRNNPP